MRSLLHAVILVVATTSLLLAASAQENLTPVAGTWRYTVYEGVVDCGALSGTRTLDESLESDTFEAEFSVYLFEDGSGILFALAGNDYVFHRSGPAEYTGSLVTSAEGVVSEIVLAVADETHMTAHEIYIPREECTSTYDLAYEWVDENAAALWTETEREFSNYTFPTCLGLVGDTVPSGTWIRNDPFVPIRLQEDPSALLIGRQTYGAVGETFFRSTDSIVAEKNHHYEWTLTPVDEDTIRIDFLYQVDERENCAVANTSNYVRISLDNAPEALLELMELPEP